MGLSAHAFVCGAACAGRVNDIVRGRRGVTAEAAMRLARYFSINAEWYRQVVPGLEFEPSMVAGAGANAAVRCGAVRLAGGRSVAVEDGLQGGRIEDAVGPDVELLQRGGLEARGGLLIERAEAFG